MQSLVYLYILVSVCFCIIHTDPIYLNIHSDSFYTNTACVNIIRAVYLSAGNQSEVKLKAPLYRPAH